MNNRLGLGLAVGAGYLLGRTKKLKFAFAVGTFVAGKKLQLSPKALMDFASSQLQNNPQFKEMGDQLREDMRGVGKAATGAIINRQLSGLADKLHDRTLNVQDKAAGIVPDISSLKDDKKQDEEEYDGEEEAEEREEPRRRPRPRKQSSGSSSSSGSSGSSSSSGTAKKSTGTAGSAAKKTASSGTAKKTAGGTAKKTTGTARKTASGATGTAKKTAARRTSGAKGGQDRG
ncbi:DNA primase [Streptomyces sp. NPDC058657]|uniref:DNA primase n=1 Tax=unclassified Streptomyces TaxID=2593676 RepID=UPI003647417D